MTTQTTNVIDPVCGMQINPETAAGSSTLDGETYHFCSRGCETKFEAAPERYTPSRPEKTAGCCSSAHSCC